MLQDSMILNSLEECFKRANNDNAELYIQNSDYFIQIGESFAKSTVFFMPECLKSL